MSDTTQPAPAGGPRQGDAHTAPIPDPPVRRLRGYAFDPALSIQLETHGINEIVYKVPWEKALGKGPIGEYLEVIDYDPASACFYAPVDLNHLTLIAQDGLAPAEGNPQFHQQMAYAVAMTTIHNFEQALGRKVQWRSHTARDGQEIFVQRLRIYPHAMREANAYYSPAKKSLLFGYFPSFASRPEAHLVGGMVFSCLSHDIIAHETTHALLDGMHRRYIELTNHDTLAFHEAFSDIIALLQHFSFPEVLRQQIAKARGDLRSDNLLGQLAQEFGVAIGSYGALRDAIGRVNPDTGRWEPLKPDPRDYQTVTEPHARGSILVAAIFDAFIAIYNNRVADLLRIASGGTGVLPSGAFHPDLVNRLAMEASKAAAHVLQMAVRALDYCPPVDMTFGDYLRALITADVDIVPNDQRGYRVAVIEAFRRRGIYPQNIRSLSIESVCWPAPYPEDQSNFKQIARRMGFVLDRVRYLSSRREAFNVTAEWRAGLHNFIRDRLEDLPAFERLTGLALQAVDIPGEMKTDASGKPRFEVHSLNVAQRVGPDGDLLNQLIVAITQQCTLPLDPARPDGPTFTFRSGCNLILDLDDFTLRCQVLKPIWDDERQRRQREFVQQSSGGSLRAAYFTPLRSGATFEPFALLHRDL